MEAAENFSVNVFENECKHITLRIKGNENLMTAGLQKSFFIVLKKNVTDYSDIQ